MFNLSRTETVHGIEKFNDPGGSTAAKCRAVCPYEFFSLMLLFDNKK